MSINLLRYAGVYVITVLVTVLLSAVVPRLFGVEFPLGFGTIAPSMVAAMVEGQMLVRKTTERIGGRPAWRAAFSMTGVAVAINVILFLLALINPEARALILGAPMWALVVAVFLIGVTLLVNRFFFGFAGNNELKRMARG